MWPWEFVLSPHNSDCSVAGGDLLEAGLEGILWWLGVGWLGSEGLCS